MIATPARDDLFLLGAAKDVVEIPDQLDVGFVRVGPGQAEVDLGHMIRRAVQYHLGQSDRRLGAMPHIGMVIGQFLGLIGNSIGNVGPAIAHVHTVETGKGIQQAVAVTVFDMTTRSAGDDALRDVATGEFSQMCGGVEKVVAVPLFKLVVAKHGSPIGSGGAPPVSMKGALCTQPTHPGVRPEGKLRSS